MIALDSTSTALLLPCADRIHSLGFWSPEWEELGASSSETDHTVNKEEEVEKPEEMLMYTATVSGPVLLSHLKLIPPHVNWALETQVTKLMGPKREAWTSMQVSGGTFPVVTPDDKSQGSSGRVLLGAPVWCL